MANVFNQIITPESTFRQMWMAMDKNIDWANGPEGQRLLKIIKQKGSSPSFGTTGNLYTEFINDLTVGGNKVRGQVADMYRKYYGYDGGSTPQSTPRSTALTRTQQRSAASKGGSIVKQPGGGLATTGNTSTGGSSSSGGRTYSGGKKVNINAGGVPTPGNPGGYGNFPPSPKPNNVKVNVPTPKGGNGISLSGLVKNLGELGASALAGLTGEKLAETIWLSRGNKGSAKMSLLGGDAPVYQTSDNNVTAAEEAVDRAKRRQDPLGIQLSAPTATLSDTPPVEPKTAEEITPYRSRRQGLDAVYPERKPYRSRREGLDSVYPDRAPKPSAPPAPPPVEEIERTNINGIEQKGKKLSSSDLSSLGITDASRFWGSEIAAGDAPAAGDPKSIAEATQGVKPVDRSTLPELSEEDKALTSPMYANAARNAARRAFLDAPAGQGVMGAINARNRAVGGDYENGFNVGGKHYQWADGVDQRQKSAAMYALSGGAGNTKEGFDEFAQNFLKDYVKNTPGVIGHTPEAAVEFQRPDSDYKPNGKEYKNVKYISPDPSQGFVAPDAGYQALTQQINF